jgi:formate/nitrite transporter FocA (FNT family)
MIYSPTHRKERAQFRSSMLHGLFLTLLGFLLSLLYSGLNEIVQTGNMTNITFLTGFCIGIVYIIIAQLAYSCREEIKSIERDEKRKRCRN